MTKYGKNKSGFLFKIPQKIGGVIEIPQRNLADIRPIFKWRKYVSEYRSLRAIRENY
jgi:hypothetical protein